MKRTILSVVGAALIGCSLAYGAFKLGYRRGLEGAQLDADATSYRIATDALKIAEKAAEAKMVMEGDLEICKADLRTTFNALESCLEENQEQVVNVD